MPITEDIVARANADLQRAHRDMEAAQAKLGKAQSEVADLEAFLRTLERYTTPSSASGLSDIADPVTHLIGKAAENTTGRTPSRPGTMARQLADACIEAIKNNYGPMKIGDLLDVVLSQGFVVGGQDQKSNLAGTLSRDPRLFSHGRTLGWDIIESERAAIEPGSEDAALSIDTGGTNDRTTLAFPDVAIDPLS